MMHGGKNIAATLRNVACVPWLPFDLCSLIVIQKEHIFTLDHEGAHILDGRVLFRKGRLGN